MRSLIQLTIRRSPPSKVTIPTTEAAAANSVATANTPKELVRTFLATYKYLPTPIVVSQLMYDEIMQIDEIQPNEGNLGTVFKELDQTVLIHNEDLALKHNTVTDLRNAVRVLSSIPKEPSDERSSAVINAAYSISSQIKRPSGTNVPGVVSIREDRVEVRFRHQNARALEEATGVFVRDAWKEMGKADLFEAFADNETVAIREPFSTENVYQGTIRTPHSIVSRLRETVRSNLSEFVVFVLSFVLCVLFLWLSLSVLNEVKRTPADQKEFLADLLWKQGWYDRMSTATFTTGVYSAIELISHFARIYRTPAIHWR